MGTKVFFFDFEKVEKILGDFRAISQKITGHKTPNFVNFRKFFFENAIKITSGGT